jgi:glycosyltransferase involved in cell wall biosynthesis
MPSNHQIPYELSIVMPCLNEAETVAICIRKAKHFLNSYDLQGEIIVADNGSTDNSPAIAQAEGARVVLVTTLGYGSSLLGGIQAAQGKYVIMGDADDSYDFAALTPFLTQLRAGFDLVMGNRFQGGIQPQAMPILHKYLGNPILSKIGQLFFRSPMGDFHCGLRGFNREAILKLDLRTTGMEFASEMVVKATLHQLRITEVPIILYQDGRSHPSHLNSWRDGWRHLRLLLMYSPRWLFLYPGLILIVIGVLGIGILLPGPVTLGKVTFDIHTLLISSTAIIVGSQLVTFAILAKQFAINAGLLPDKPHFRTILEKISLEKFLIMGGLLILLGTVGIFYSVYWWGAKAQFGSLVPNQMMRLLVPAITLVAVGFQIVMFSFFKSILELTIQKN